MRGAAHRITHKGKKMEKPNNLTALKHYEVSLKSEDLIGELFETATIKEKK